MTDTKERVPLSMFGSEGRIIQGWVNARRGVRILFVCMLHSEGWTLRDQFLMEAVVKESRTTRHLVEWFVRSIGP